MSCLIWLLDFFFLKTDLTITEILVKEDLCIDEIVVLCGIWHGFL